MEDIQSQDPEPMCELAHMCELAQCHNVQVFLREAVCELTIVCPRR